MEMKRKVYPVCEKCSTVINPKLHVDVAPGFVVNREVYCARCFKDDMQEQLEWLLKELDKDPEAVAEVMGIGVIDIPED